MAFNKNIYTGSIALPAEVSSQILSKVQEDSAIMRLATKIDLPGRGVTIPVITGDPEASWVGETDEKPVSRPTMDTKLMTPYTLAVIVPFSNQFRNSSDALYRALVERLPKALAKKFDQTVFGGVAPGSNFDVMTAVTAQDLGTDAYGALVAAYADIAAHDGHMNGVALSPAGEGVLLSSTDTTGHPLFNGVEVAGIPRILGAEIVPTKAAYIAGSPNLVGVAGDWTQAMYGTVEGVQITISEDATLTDGENTINLFQRNMFAVRAEIEIGFRADLSVFNRLTKA